MKSESIFDNVYLQLFIAAFFWGGSSIAAKILMQTASPCVATFTRFFGATVILFFIVRIKSKGIKLTTGEHIQLIILGIIGITLCYFFYFIGLFFSSTFNAALFEATTPLLTFLIALILGYDKFDKFQFIGLIIAYLGVVTISSQGSIYNIITMKFNIGDILLLISTVCFALYNIFYKKFVIKISETLETYYIFFYGTLGLIPWLIYDIKDKGGLQIEFSIKSIACILFLAAGSSVISYLMFNKGIAKLGASKASECINLVPVIAIILTLVVLRDFPNWYQILRAVIIVIGMYVSKMKKS